MNHGEVVVGFDGSSDTDAAVAYALEQAGARGARLHPALADASRDADLLVLGSRGLGRVAAAVLGSVSHAVLHRAHCPVAVVPLRGDPPSPPHST